ncbi:MAG TPA: peptidase MA family metallohydrolase [Anaerolineaceae bacterium]
MLKTLLALLVAFGGIFSSGSKYPPEQDITLNNQAVNVHFGEYLDFSAQVSPIGKVQSAYIFITSRNHETITCRAAIDSQGMITCRQDMKQLGFPPFVYINYWYQINLTQGDPYLTSKFTIEYKDDRFSWHSLQNQQFQVFWYNRDLAFGQTVLNVAQHAIQSAQNVISESVPSPVRIYIYNTGLDLQAALRIEDSPWVAGHALADSRVILLSIPSGPEQKLELERQVPHELVHILQYQAWGEKSKLIPTWLIEGMASNGELYPNLEYQRVLSDAVKMQSTIPIVELCNGFPREASNAYLAYAQSASFVSYLYKKYGTSGVQKLSNAYLDGMGCEEGPSFALGNSLSQIENRWKQEALADDPSRTILQNLSPYLIISALLFVPLAITLSGKVFRRKPGKVITL